MTRRIRLFELDERIGWRARRPKMWSS